LNPVTPLSPLKSPFLNAYKLFVFFMFFSKLVLKFSILVVAVALLMVLVIMSVYVNPTPVTLSTNLESEI
jgi:hypothetical protein